MSSEKEKVISGFGWKLAERLSSQGVSFILSIILARILSPTEYGSIAMINIFIALANVFITNGFSASLIQNKDSDDIDYSTNLYLSIAISVLFYIAIFVASPYIADFYGIPELTSITRVYSLSLFLLSYNSIQNAWVSRHMIFKKFFFATFGGTLMSGLIGVFMAYNGCGVWSLVAQYLCNLLINMLIMRSIVPWRPKLVFSWRRGRKMFKYGSNLILSGLLGTGFNQLRQLLIGKIYSPADLAYFNRGSQFPNLIHQNIDVSVSQVLFPVMANHNDDNKRVKQMTRRSIRTSSYIMFFAMTTLAVVAYPLTHLVLTDKWIACVPFIQIICLDNMLGSISTINTQTVKAIGRSDILLKLELMKKPVFFFMLIISSQISLMAVALSMPLYSLYANYINMKPNQKLLGYSYIEQINDYKPAALLSIATFSIAYPIKFVCANQLILLILQVTVCVLTYIILSRMFNVESLLDIKNSAFNIIKKNGK